jgi:hypothetical protein
MKDFLVGFSVVGCSIAWIFGWQYFSPFDHDITTIIAAPFVLFVFIVVCCAVGVAVRESLEDL